MYTGFVSWSPSSLRSPTPQTHLISFVVRITDQRHSGNSIAKQSSILETVVHLKTCGVAAIVALEQILLIAPASRVAECNVWSHMFFTGYIDHLVSKCTVFLFEGQQPWVVHLVHGLVTHNGEQGLVVHADREIVVSQAEHLPLGNCKSLPFHQRVAILGVLEESGACHDELPVTGTTVCPQCNFLPR